MRFIWGSSNLDELAIFVMQNTVMEPIVEKYFLGKVIVITGGSSGIGLALAQEMLRGGATVVILADQIERLEDAARELGGRSARVGAYACDIGIPAEVTATSREVIAAFGIPDILI